MITSFAKNTFVFKRELWPTNDDGIAAGRRDSFNAIPESWDAPWKDAARKFHEAWRKVNPSWMAVLCCPKCKQIAAISSEIHSIDHNGKLTRVFECPHKCGFWCHAVLSGWNKKELFCMAYERDGKPGLSYLHANDAEEARRLFGFAARAHRSLTKVVAIAPVLGYIVKDKDEKVLLA